MTKDGESGDQGLTLETSASRWPIYPVLFHRRSTTVSIETHILHWKVIYAKLKGFLAITIDTPIPVLYNTYITSKHSLHSTVFSP